MKLIIDTRSNEKTIIALVVNGKRIEESLQTNHVHSQAVLPLIEKILSEHKFSLKDITNIEVPVDTGSYTGRRVGVAIAQALGRLLSVPVNGKPVNQPITIPYDTDKW
jgi:tRNA A37 threonylcarbamoyladenosine modification protein TsaB